MITKPTLFILGAGASKCYGYPTGAELKADIIKNFKFIFDKYLKRPNHNAALFDESIIDKFIYSFDNSANPMIDYFLANREDEPEIINFGKIAIAAIIIDAEIRSKKKQKIEFQKDDWFEILFHEMSKGIRRNNLDKFFSGNKVSFITFNYDRTLEEYFFKALITNYSIDPVKAFEYVLELKIKHVFGRLPWYDERFYDQYGQVPRREYLIAARDSIKTLNERKNIEIKAITQMIEEAKKIFFLGFGYADENLQLLNISDSLQDDAIIYGTALGVSAENKNYIKSKFLAINRLDNDPQQPDRFVKLLNQNCRELLINYIKV